MPTGTLFSQNIERRMGWQDARRHMARGIFISHKQEDLYKAIEVASAIRDRANVHCYVDQLDPYVKGDSPELVSHIQEVIHGCQSLLAVVSRNTQSSWWVPLEIGVALENQKHIGSYTVGLSRLSLPSYLWTWPIMATNQEAVAWARGTRNHDAGILHRTWRRMASTPEAFYRSL